MRAVARAALATGLHRLNTVRGGRLITDSKLVRIICGHGYEVATLRCGAQAVVPVDDHVGRAMYLWGQHDPRLATVIDTIVGSSDTVLDIGANFGVLGLLAAKKVGPTGKVHLFEPQPLVASCLRASLSMNGFNHAEVHECALSDSSGFRDMTIIDPDNLGMTAITSLQDNVKSNRIRVLSENAADYIESLQCQRVSVVKLDVEGHEGAILQSMRPWIKKARPPFILFECHVGRLDFERHDSVRVLSELGYHFFTYDIRRYWTTRLQRVTETTNVSGGYDFVALHTECLDSPPARRFMSLLTS